MSKLHHGLNISIKLNKMFINSFVVFCSLHGLFEASFYEIIFLYFRILTASDRKKFRKKTLQTAHEGEKNTTNASINISFNFIAIFRPRCNLDMQFSELYL